MSKKRRAPQGYKVKPVPTPPPEQEVVEEVVEEAIQAEDLPDEVYDIPTWEHSLIDVTPEPVSEKELTNLIKDWRRGRATQTILQALSDGYVMVFAIIMILAMLGGGVYQAQKAAALCDSTACGIGRPLLPWVAMGASFALTAMASKIFGPVVASAAEGFWLMDAPIRRGRLLWKRLVGVVVVVGLAAAVLGGLLAALTGYDFSHIWKWALAMGVGAAGLTALAASEQTWGRTWLISLIQWLCGAAAIAILFLIVSVAASWFGLSAPSLPSTDSVIWVAAAGGVILIVCGAIALSRLGMIHRARLVSGGSLVAGMQGAAFAMDFGLMRDILVERDSMRRGHVRPQRGGGQGTSALVWRELQRVWRYPKRLLLVVISVVVPYAVAALGFHTFSPFISALILLIGFVPLLGSMRVLTRTKGLSRTLPFSNPQIRRATATVPAIIAVLWACATTPAFFGVGEHYTSVFSAFITAALTAVAGLLGAVRWVTAKSANYSAPMMQTGFGALPPGLMFNLIRGIDIVVLITGPLLLGWAWYISAIIAVISAIVLSGAYSMEEMTAMREEMQKEQAKSGKPGPGGGLGGMLAGRTAPPPTKQKIAPPRGYRTPPVSR